MKVWRKMISENWTTYFSIERGEFDSWIDSSFAVDFFEYLRVGLNFFAIFSIEFKTQRKCKNAGVDLTIMLFSWIFTFAIFDVRDWDYVNDKPKPLNE